MAVTFGFYNSKNGDRAYDALQMSSIFDGIIMDGVFQNIGAALMVKASTGMMVNVGIGRAWFDHTWTLNDSLLPLTIDLSEVILHRIDAIVLDVDTREDVRANSIIVVKGTPSSSPKNPTLIKDDDHKQYPLAYIRVNAGATEITQSNITNKVGSADTPFIVCPLEHVSTDELMSQWVAEWNEFYSAKTSEMENEIARWNNVWETFYRTYTTDMNNTSTYWKTTWENLYNSYTQQMNDFSDKLDTSYLEWSGDWDKWYSEFTEMNRNVMDTWRNQEQENFDAWFADIQTELSGDVAGNLETQIKDLQEKTDKLEDAVMSHEYGPDGTLNIFRPIFDDSYDASNPDMGTSSIILDNENNPIESTTPYILLTPTISKNKRLIERGICLGDSITEEQANAINRGTFENIYLGDYWDFKGSDGTVVRAIVVDFNYGNFMNGPTEEDYPSVTLLSLSEISEALQFTRGATTNYVAYFGRWKKPSEIVSNNNLIFSKMKASSLSEKIGIGYIGAGLQPYTTSSETDTSPSSYTNYSSTAIVPELSMLTQQHFRLISDDGSSGFAFKMSIAYSGIARDPSVLSYFATDGLKKLATMVSNRYIVYSGIHAKKCIGAIHIINIGSFGGSGVELAILQCSVSSEDTNILVSPKMNGGFVIPQLFEIQSKTKRLLTNL